PLPLSSKSASHIHQKRESSLSSFPSQRDPFVHRGRPHQRSPQPPHLRPTLSESAAIDPFLPSTLQLPPPRPRMDRQLRSQYPQNSPENHVEYILVAGFDIDRGSVMEHQYPAPISGNENMLAELMLPDQAHMRKQDWTIFFLHKDTTAEEEEREARRERRRRRKLREEGHEDAGAEGEDGAEDGDSFDDGEETDEEGFEGPPLVYVLNLVNTKQDNTVKRGAVVRAMAICTRHSFLHIYKPLLLLALDEYFRSPVPETLASLYDALNSMDLSLMPKLSFLERNILQASTSTDMFIEKFEQMIVQRQAEEAAAHNLALTKTDSAGGSPLRNKINKYTLPRDTHEFESKVEYNGIPVPVKVPTAISPEQVGDFSLIKLIQTFSEKHASSPQPFTLHQHLTTSGAYTHPIIVLVNAVLTQKRIVFLGHNLPSGEVAEAVLAACALASGGILRGFTRHAFPYTDLTKIDDLLKVPGFIAGVTNPAFAHKPEWWDLLCDLPTGRMKISHKIEGVPPTEGFIHFQQQLSHLPASSNAAQALAADVDPTGDTQFMESLLSAIAERRGEAVIRTRWRDYISKFTRISSTFEELVYGASALHIGASPLSPTSPGTVEAPADPNISGHGYVWASEPERLKELAANVHRIEGWRNTRSYYSFVQDLGHVWERQPIRGMDLMWLHDRLRATKLSHEQSAGIYLALAREIGNAAKQSVAAAAAVAKEKSSGRSTTPAPAPASETSPISPSDERGNTTSNNTSTATTAAAAAASQLQYDTILQLLTVTPESNSGLFYLSLGLFHPRADVRTAVVGLFDKIMVHPAGRHFWAGLGRFAKLAYFRLKREEG
ncbi:spindle pole body interacting protein, partial [Saccharata proteae CBS 121410]